MQQKNLMSTNATVSIPSIGELTRDFVIIILKNLDIKEWMSLKGLSKNWNEYFSPIIKEIVEDLPRVMHLHFSINNAQSNLFFSSIKYENTDQLAVFRVLTYLAFKTFHHNQKYPRFICKAFSKPQKLIEHCLADSVLAYLVLNSPLANQLPLEELQDISKSQVAWQLAKKDTESSIDRLIFWLTTIALIYLTRGKDTSGLILFACLFTAYCLHYVRYFAIHLIKNPTPRNVKICADEFIKKTPPPKDIFLATTFATLFHKKQTAELTGFEARCQSNLLLR